MSNSTDIIASLKRKASASIEKYDELESVLVDLEGENKLLLASNNSLR
jgi:hypothetical protein